MTQQIVLVGNGPVGHRFIEQLVQTTNADQYQITVFGEEPWVAYDRVHLTSWFEKRTVQALNMVPTDFTASTASVATARTRCLKLIGKP